MIDHLLLGKSSGRIFIYEGMGLFFFFGLWVGRGDGCGRVEFGRGWWFGGKGRGVDGRSIAGDFGGIGGEWTRRWRFFPDKEGGSWVSKGRERGRGVLEIQLFSAIMSVFGNANWGFWGGNFKASQENEWEKRTIWEFDREKEEMTKTFKIWSGVEEVGVLGELWSDMRGSWGN